MISKQELFDSMYPKIMEAMKNSIILYNRSLDPDDNEKVNIKTDFKDIEIDLNTKKGKMAVSMEKTAEVFGKSISANLTPILIEEFDNYLNNLSS